MKEEEDKKFQFPRGQRFTTIKFATQEDLSNELVKWNQSTTYYAVGVTHYEKGNFQKAFEYYTTAAKLGNPSAINNLGTMHLEGINVPKDHGKALK